MLLQELVSKINGWRYLLSSSSPLTEEEKESLIVLSSSSLISKIVSLLTPTRILMLETDEKSYETTHCLAQIREHPPKC